MNDKKTFTVYITKYALTRGILEKKVEWNPEYRRMVAVVGGRVEYYHGEGRDWHRTYSAALSRAEEMRVDKLKSLNKQITKISALKFEEP